MILPVASIVVVAVVPKYATSADSCVDVALPLNSSSDVVALCPAAGCVNGSYESRPVDVSTPPTFESPVPSSEVNVEPPSVRFVVEAVMNDPYVVDDRENLFTPEKKFVSDSNVDEANDHVDVEKLYTRPDEFTPRAPEDRSVSFNPFSVVDDSENSP